MPAIPIISNYTLHEIQGTGSFGKVYRAEWDGRLECAVKIFDKRSINEAYVSWCLEKLREEERHPNIIPVLGFDLAQVPGYAATAWVQPPANGIRSLDDATRKWSFTEKGAALSGLASAMSWLHERGIIHTGITSGNVLLLNESPGSVCVTDVGQGLIDASQAANWSAHAPFLSPERCRHEAPQGESSGEAWDVYAFGMVAFHLLTGRKHARAVDYFKKIAKLRPDAEGKVTVNLGELAQALEQEPAIAWRSRPSSDAESQLRALVERCLALTLTERYSHMRDVRADLELIDFAAVQPALKTATALAQARSIRSQRKDGATESRKPTVLPELGTLPEPSIAKSEPKPLVEVREQAPVAKKAAPSERKLAPPTFPFRWWRKFSQFGLRQGSGVALGAGAAALLAASVAGWQYRQRNHAEAEAKRLQSVADQLLTNSQKEAATTEAQMLQAKLALDEQQRLRRNLRQEQELGDSLLDTLLGQRPTDERANEAWRASLSDYTAQASERLKLMGKDPSLRESSARTRWNMAGIALALGEPQAAAGWLNEALGEVEAAAAATNNKERRIEWDLLGGKIQSRRGELSLQKGQSAEALQQLGQALKSLEGYLSVQSEDFSALRELARAAWLTGRAQLSKPDPTAALAPLNLAGDTATRLILSPAMRDSDVFLFVDSFHDLGRAYVALKRDDDALKSFLQPLQKLRDWDREHPQSEEGRYRLASGYLAMGRILARGPDGANAASKALNQGIRILLELVTEQPDKEIYTFDLGDAYGDVADLVAGPMGLADALTFAQSAVNYHANLTERNHAEPRYRLHFAAALLRVAEWQTDTGKHGEALKGALRARAILDELAGEAGLASDDQAATLQGQARGQAALGRIYEALSKKADALEAFTEAAALGQKIVALEPQNEAAKKALNWAQDQLRRLGK